MTGHSLYSLALLHGGEFSWTRFEVHFSTLIGCILWVAAYYHIIVRWRPAGAEPAKAMQQISFVGGTVLLFLSLNGPLHDLSDNYLFSAHMVQHLIVTLIVPPLWLLGLPTWSLDRLLKRGWLLATARALTNPLVAFAIYNIVFALWHLPTLYNWALVNHNVHIGQHVMFIAAAGVMWWPVIDPIPALERLQTPARLLYLAVLSIPMTMVSAILTFAEHAMYPWYAAAPRVFEWLTATDDQQLGGVIMWVPGMLVFWTALTIIFFRWSNREQKEEWEERALLKAQAPT